MFKNFQGYFIGITVSLLIVLVLIAVTDRIVEGFTIMSAEDNDPSCVLDLKVKYCRQFNAELGTTIIEPSGVFGGSPYTVDVCLGESGERLIGYEDIDYKRCTKKGGDDGF